MLLWLILAVILSAGCDSQDKSSESVEIKTAEVKRGDLTIDILASGNLAMPHEANLTFGSSGTVEEILVQVGDVVEEGQELAKLDTMALEKSLIQAQTSVKSAELSLERAKEPKTSSSGEEILSAPDPLDIEIKELQLESAIISLKEAEMQLEAAVIVAPFVGQIAEVPVLVNDGITDSTVIVRLIDPKQIEVEVLVNEMDISQVKPGAQATVQVDSMPSIALPARVISISPVATIQSGVVNYTVNVEVESLERKMEEDKQVSEGTARDFTPGEIPDRLRQAIEEGRITQEQVEEMMKRRQQGAGPQQRTPADIPEDFQLREGLTVTVSILLDQRNDVLLVPNGALINQGGNTVVRVIKDGIIEEVPVTTGISDLQYTEVIEGLSEGQEVVIPQAVASSPANTQQNRPQNPARDMQRMFR